MLQLHSELPHLFSLWIPNADRNAAHAFGIPTAMASTGFGPWLPQMPQNIPESSFLGVERGKRKPSGKGSGLQEKDSGLRNPWMESKGGKGKDRSERTGPG